MALKRIVLCADDFGMHPLVDEGILRLLQQGRLNATSCLALGPSFAQNAARLRDLDGAQCGLHLNFTESLGAQGLYLPVPRLILRAWSRSLDRNAVRAQIRMQLQAFHDGMGRAPDFVDGHQHVHQFPQIRHALLEELAQRYPQDARRPWLRSTCVRDVAGIPAGLVRKARIIQALGARALAQAAGRHGFAMNPGFLGVYDFTGGQAGYARLLGLWLAGARDGDLIMCHPAFEAVPGDALGVQRSDEYAVLSSDATAQEMAQAGAVLHRLA